MSEGRWLKRSERWFRLLLRFYPAHFREEMGQAVVETYRDRARGALQRGGLPSLGWVWLRALTDSLRNGIGERLRPSIAWRRLGAWGRDSELVFRRLGRAPLFVGTMVGTLAVGLGAFAVVYVVVDNVLLEPLPYQNPDDVYVVWRDYGWFDLDRGALAGTDITTLDAAGGVIQDAVGVDRETVTLTGGADAPPQEVGVLVSSPDLFEFLGVRPALGRGFAPDEVGPGRPNVVVLGHGLWTQTFGADPGVLGTELRLDGDPYTVIGVMGPDFRFIQPSGLGAPEDTDLYVTFDHHLAETPPVAGSYGGLVRAAPGASPEAVEAAVARVGEIVDERDFEGKGLRLYAVGMKEDLVSKFRPALVALGLAGLLLVLVLMVNLAALLLVRATRREREFAISRALGADRPAIVRATLLEGGVLGALGGVSAALVAMWGARTLAAMAPADLPRRASIAMDAESAAVVVGVGLLLGLVAGAVPATWATRTRLATLLQRAAVRGGGGHLRMRRGLVVVQVALALVLLSTGGLVVRSFEQLLRADPGFEPADVLTLRVPTTGSQYPGPEEIRAVQDRIHAGLAALPGVRAVGAVSDLPLTAQASQVGVRFPAAPGNTGDPDHDQPLVDRFHIRPGFFEALRIPVLAGRGFEEGSLGAGEAVIDRTLAAQFFSFPAGDPVGATLVYGADSLTVVGVVEHARQYDVHEDGYPQVYLPADEYVHGSLYWTLRTDRPALSLASDARAAIWRIDRGLAVADVRTMDQAVSDSLRQQQVSAVLIAGFALGALLLAAMGIYGVVAGSVTRRHQEIAVRMAFGAERDQVLRLIVGEGMSLVLLGVLVGTPGVIAASRVLDASLVGVSPFDPLTLGAVAVGLALVALTACYLPGRRVSGIDPMGLLRQE